MKILSTILIWGLLSFQVLSQKLTLVSLEDRRSLGNSYFGNRCEIELKTAGDEARKYKYVKIVALTKAIDSEGTDLLREKAEKYDYEPIGEEKIKIEIKNPMRKATAIAELAGTLSFFNPTEANGAILKVANFQSKPNVNLLPKNAPVSVAFFTKESLEKLKKEQQAQREAKMKQLDPLSRQLAEGLMGLIEGFSSFGGENELSFLIEGETQKLVDIKFEDATGKEIKRMGRFVSGGNLFSYSFESKPAPDWRMRVLVETKNSVSTVPFSLKNIELP
ncbi:MAG: hypothetical protein ACK4GN_10030 [Runella sp.]